MTTTIILTIEHEKDIENLTDLLAIRCYTVLKENSVGVKDVTAHIECKEVV